LVGTHDFILRRTKGRINLNELASVKDELTGSVKIGRFKLKDLLIRRPLPFKGRVGVGMGKFFDYILGFECLEKKLVVEVYGNQQGEMQKRMKSGRRIYWEPVFIF
jgi:hypothetical protein